MTIAARIAEIRKGATIISDIEGDYVDMSAGDWLELGDHLDALMARVVELENSQVVEMGPVTTPSKAVERLTATIDEFWELGCAGYFCHTREHYEAEAKQWNPPNAMLPAIHDLSKRDKRDEENHRLREALEYFQACYLDPACSHYDLAMVMGVTALKGSGLSRNAELKEALRELLGEATYPAWAGDSCRSCPDASDGGCCEPHDDNCPWHMAVENAKRVLANSGKPKSPLLPVAVVTTGSCANCHKSAVLVDGGDMCRVCQDSAYEAVRAAW